MRCSAESNGCCVHRWGQSFFLPCDGGDPPYSSKSWALSIALNLLSNTAVSACKSVLVHRTLRILAIHDVWPDISHFDPNLRILPIVRIRWIGVPWIHLCQYPKNANFWLILWSCIASILKHPSFIKSLNIVYKTFHNNIWLVVNFVLFLFFHSLHALINWFLDCLLSTSWDRW